MYGNKIGSKQPYQTSKTNIAHSKLVLAGFKASNVSSIQLDKWLNGLSRRSMCSNLITFANSNLKIAKIL